MKVINTNGANRAAGLTKSILLILSLAAGLLISINQVCLAQENIIFDTDMGSDCDDAGAMAVMHKLADQGEIRILGVMFSSNRNKYGIGVCDAINHYYKRGNIPLGQLTSGSIGDERDFYSRDIAEAKIAFPHSVVDSTTEIVRSYKSILSAQPDTSVTIVTVGHPYALSLLLKDPAGKKLIIRKVKKWVAMTQTGEKPFLDWNFGKNGTADCVGTLLAEWPTKIYFSGSGKTTLTGHRKLPLQPLSNPVRRAYELWNTTALTQGRSSWDQIAVLFAARPQYFQIDCTGSLVQNNKHETSWDPNIDRANHFKVTPTINNTDLEAIIEELMCMPPDK